MAKVHDNVLYELLAAGMRPHFRPKKLAVGWFHFLVAVPATGSTAVNVLADANNVSQNLQRVIGSGATPAAILHVEKLRWAIEKGSETEAIYGDILERSYLYHDSPEGIDIVDLAEYAESVSGVWAVEDTNTATAVIRSASHPAREELLPFPMRVNMQTDVLEVRFQSAITPAAAVPTRLSMYGCAWQSVNGTGETITCPTKEAALAIRTISATARRALQSR